MPISSLRHKNQLGGNGESTRMGPTPSLSQMEELAARIELTPTRLERRIYTRAYSQGWKRGLSVGFLAAVIGCGFLAWAWSSSTQTLGG